MNKSPLLRLLALARPQKKILWQALFLLLVATACDVSGPLLIRYYIDDHLVHGEVWNATVMWMLLAYIGCLLLAATCNYAQAVRLNDVALTVIRDLREKVFARALRLPTSMFDRTPTGTMVSRITNDTEFVKELFVNVVGSYVQSIFRIVGIFIAMAFLDVDIMLVCALFLPAVIVVMLAYRKFSTPVYQRARALLSDINGSLSESVQGVRVIQMFGQESRFMQRFTRLSDDYFRVRHKNLKLDAALLRPLVDFLHSLVLAGLVFYFGQRALSESVEVGVIYAFINYLGRFIEPVNELTQRLSVLQQATVAGERVFNLLDTPEAPEFSGGRIPGDTALRLEDVCFRYAASAPDVIRHASVNIEPGSFTGIVGHTGSGKSTLMSLLLRFYTPVSGRVLVGDVPLAEVDAQWLRGQFGLVPQDAFLFPGTVFDNLVVGLQRTPKQVQSALETLGLLPVFSRLPQGLETSLTERGSNISAGQRQLIALARALLREPAVLILDEATASIDSATEREVQAVLQRLHGKVTVIAIAHRISTIMEADTILVMHHGEILERGDHASLMRQRGVYHTLYQMQSQPLLSGHATLSSSARDISGAST